MDPSAQNTTNLMQQGLANSSQLGGGANGDHSMLNGDQVILNPLSNQIRDQQQQRMAEQMVAANRAQAMNMAQMKQAQQTVPPKNGAPQGSIPSQNPAPQSPTPPQGQGAQPSSAQPVKPPASVPPSAPVQSPPTQPVQPPGTIQSPPPQSPVQQPVQNQNQAAQQQVPMQPQPGTIQNPATQQPYQQVQQQPMQQPQPMQNQQFNGQIQPGIMPGTIQNPAAQGPVPQQAPQGFQQPYQQVQPMQQQQVVQQQPMQQPQPMQPGIIQNPAPQNQAPQQGFQQGFQQQGVQPGTMPGTMQNPASQQGGMQPEAFSAVPGVIQPTAPQPGTLPGTMQNPASQQGFQQPQQQNGQQDATQNSNTISAEQAVKDTFIPITQLISGNHDPIQDLHQLVAGSVVPDELRVILNDRIKRLGLIKEGAGLSSMYILELESTTRYINWCVGLPWTTKTEDTLDLAKAKEILDKHHYGLDMLKNRMLEFIASIMLNLQNNGPDFASRSPILCFVGLAGTGKTTFAKSMAEALGRKFERVPFGGMADSRVLRGQSRYFPDAEPGQFMKSLSRAKSKNPVILLDEIDRVTETARADIMGVLIEALDPEQNAAFTDHYIDYPFSLANCLFVATSNNISTIATAVLDRMEIIQMPNYNDEEKKVIGRDYVLPKVRSLMGLREDQLIIDEGVWDVIIRPLGYDPGVRALDRIIGMICRRAARLIVSGEAENVRVTPQNMKPFVQDF